MFLEQPQPLSNGAPLSISSWVIGTIALVVIVAFIAFGIYRQKRK